MLYTFTVSFSDGTKETYSSENISCSFEYEFPNEQITGWLKNFPDCSNSAFLIQSSARRMANDNSIDYISNFQTFKTFCEKIILKMQDTTIKISQVEFLQNNAQVLNISNSEIIALSFSGGVNTLDDLNDIGCVFQLYVYYTMKGTSNN